MVEPYLIQPDYSNAMVKGLSTNLAYIAESKKGGGNIMRGGGGGKEKLSGPQQAVEDSRILQENLAKENKERNEEYKKRQAAEDKENLMAERQEKETTAKVQKDEAEAKKKFSEQFLSYAPAVTQKNYGDWLLFGEENKLNTSFFAKPEDVAAMKPEEFKAYMGGLGGTVKPKEKSLHFTTLVTPEGVPISQDPDSGGYTVPGAGGTPMPYQGKVIDPKAAGSGGKQILQTNEGYVIVDKNNPEFKQPLNLNKPLTADQQDTVEKLKTLKDTVSQIETLYDKNYVGMVQGRKGAVATKTGIGTDEKEQMFRAKTAELMKMVYALSGKQINQQELERLRPFIPEANDSDISFETKLKAFKNQLDDVLANKVGTYLGDIGAEDKPTKPKFEILSVE